MEFLDIERPSPPKDTSRIFTFDIPPLKRLELMDDTEFEEIILEWAYFYLSNKYKKVKRFGGAGDMGRDIVGYYDNGDIDIYQCKHYKNQLTPSEFWIEFGKLCYYTYKNKYRIPKKYYIATTKGIGPALSNLIDNPESIASELIKNWQGYCMNKITKDEEIQLDEDFKKYIHTFDFSIVEELEPIKFLDEYSTTKWYKYRFGGGLPKRKLLKEINVAINEDEKDMRYIIQLIDVYREKTNNVVFDLDSISNSSACKEHLYRQRLAFHSAQALKVFTRDELIDIEPYEEAKEQIYLCIADIIVDEYDSSFKRVSETIKYLNTVPLEINPLGNIQPTEKCGICHELVNDERICWVVKDE